MHDPAETAGIATMTARPTPLPAFDDVRAAARRLHGLAVMTPLLESHALN